MVTGLNVSLAILNQIKENDQNIIERITEPYILILLFIIVNGKFHGVRK